MTDMERFRALRKRVMKAIKKELEEDDYCKSYEGTFEWTVCYPNYFEDEEGESGAELYVLTLHCYVLGWGRHYEWYGRTMKEALNKAEAEINGWIGGDE